MLIQRNESRRAALVCGVAAAALTAATPALAAPIDIDAQLAGPALRELAQETGTNILFTPEAVAGLQAPAIRGDLAPEEAARLLVAGSGLAVMRDETGAILIGREGASGPQSEGAGGGAGMVDELIVTAQKKDEAIQDVPIAISAFTQKSLEAQKIEGGFDLLKAIPNVTFSKSNFTGYNFSIRGIGTKAVSATTDPGVAVSFNNATLIVNRLFEQEYVDVERVEVLRGPQGTLFGRNATSGVINVISAKPRMGEFEGSIKLETGNYNTQRARGHVNVPLGDTLAVRGAFAMTKRDGYGYNEADGSDVDDRDLWTARLTVGWEPSEIFRVNVLWERFEEDDKRVRTSKQLCHHDPGPDHIAHIDVNSLQNPQAKKAMLTQGCLPGSLYDMGIGTDPSMPAGPAHGAYGTPHGGAIPFFGALTPDNILAMSLGGNPYFGTPPSEAPCSLATVDPFWRVLSLCRLDPYGRLGQSRDLRTIYSLIEPKYRAKSDIFDVSIDIDITDSVTFTSQTVYSLDDVYSTQDFNRFTTIPVFNDSTLGCATFSFSGPCPDPGAYADPLRDLTPGGIFTDPQLGPSNSAVGQDISSATSKQFNQEFRLASNFDGPVNFSLGGNYTRFTTLNDYYVFFNVLNMIIYGGPFSVPFGACGDLATFPDRGDGFDCAFYVDRNPLESIDGQGHNYFRSQNPYRLSSAAMFGEIYWQATETVKVTLGARMTWDRKTFTPIPSQTLLADYRGVTGLVPPGGGPEYCNFLTFCQIMATAINGYGYPASPDIVQEWTEPTGRLVVDWKPDLDFTDESMVYLSLAHGYKGGGANPPGIAWPQGMFIAEAQGAASGLTFEPEFIDAIELGTKNTLLGGGLVLNAALFYYDYKGYQVSKIVDRAAANENFDSQVGGVELEWIYSPTRNLRFNGAFGALRTKIADGEQSIDLMDRTQGGHVVWTSPDGRTFDDWVVIKPWLTQASNCIAPAIYVASHITNAGDLRDLCPGGNFLGVTAWPGGSGIVRGLPGNVKMTAPNGGAGFFADLSGKELPNAPHWTASLGGQYRMTLPGGWDATLRADFYWQSQSYARVYNTQYDRLRAWTNSNVSFWVENADWGVTAEVYVKNAMDQAPITDTFLNSDDAALTTNVFTLDPRLVGVSVRKSF